MNGRELDTFAKILKISEWRGIFFANQIPPNLKPKNIYIINCCSSREKSQGHHWIAVHIKSKYIVEIFDSSGLHPNQIKHLKLPPNRKIHYSSKRLQNYRSDTCGLYCLFFVKLRSSGVLNWNFIPHYFGENLKKNDTFIRHWAKKNLKIL